MRLKMELSKREIITRMRNNAEYVRAQGDIQGCIEFRQIADWIEQLANIEQIYSYRLGTPIYKTLSKIGEVLKDEIN